MKTIVLQIDSIQALGLYAATLLAYLKAYKNNPEDIADNGFRRIKTSQISEDLSIDDDFDIEDYLQYLEDLSIIKSYNFSESREYLFYKLND
jgi:hypothetical protein